MAASYKAPQVKFDGHTTYHDTFQGYSFKPPGGDLSHSQHQCIVDKLNVPPVNYVNDKNHIYYDPDSKKFV